MSTLMLVRHGQAAAFSEDSDRLTDLGRTQARALGEYLVVLDTTFDEVWTGSLRRQQETAAIVAGCYRDAGRPFPDARVEAGWNEYDSAGVTGVLAPRLAAEDPAFATRVAEFVDSAGKPDRNRAFQRMFEIVMERWIGGDLTDDRVESFDAFHARVLGARDAVLASPGSRRVLVFTSGGPIGACVQAALDAPPRQAIQVNWRVRNASLTEFLFAPGRLSLDSFNRTPHLADPALQSFR